MAEMTTLVATIYRKYHTSIGAGFENTTPAITARVEIFHEERFRAVKVRFTLLVHLSVAYQVSTGEYMLDSVQAYIVLIDYFEITNTLHDKNE